MNMHIKLNIKTGHYLRNESITPPHTFDVFDHMTFISLLFLHVVNNV